MLVAAVGFKGDTYAAPNAIDIVDNIASLGGRGFRVRAVGVVQLGGGDGDVVLCNSRTRLCDLLCCCGRTGCALLDKHTGAVAGANVRAASRCVDVADGGQTTIYINPCILQVFKLPCICLAGSEAHGDEFAAPRDITVRSPLIVVVGIQLFPAAYCQVGTRGNIYFDACQKCGILIDRDLSGLNIDRNIVVHRKVKAPGIDIRTAQIQRQCVQLCIAVYREYQPVSCLIIILSKASGLHLEHTVISDKGDCRCKDLA